MANDDLVIDPWGVRNPRITTASSTNSACPQWKVWPWTPLPNFIGVALSSLIEMWTKFSKLNGRVLHLAC